MGYPLSVFNKNSTLKERERKTVTRLVLLKSFWFVKLIHVLSLEYASILKRKFIVRMISRNLQVAGPSLPSYLPSETKSYNNKLWTSACIDCDSKCSSLSPHWHRNDNPWHVETFCHGTFITIVDSEKKIWWNVFFWCTAYPTSSDIFQRSFQRLTLKCIGFFEMNCGKKRPTTRT